MSLRGLVVLMVCSVWSAAGSRGRLPSPASLGHLDGLTDALLQEVVARMEGQLPQGDFDPSLMLSRVAKEYDDDQLQPRFRSRQDDVDGILGKEPSIRDQEYLQHSSLWGHQYMQGGAGEGAQRLKPDGSMKNVQVVKTDAVLPAYCNPPNPCPVGYTSDDGCLEDFSNTATFSREYQASQECMCDTEHMFDCPGTTQENEIDALARSIQNEGIMDTTLDRIVQDMQIEGQHKSLVAKKFFVKKNVKRSEPKRQKARQNNEPYRKRYITNNPYLQGEQLPVVAKKAPHLSQN